jgi:hypothetical protein
MHPAAEIRNLEWHGRAANQVLKQSHFALIGGQCHPPQAGMELDAAQK